MDVGMMMVFASYGWDDCSADLGFDCLCSAEHQLQ
jgi:hypothetical protein